MAFKDNVSANDWIVAGLGSATGPAHPCPECGKESKEHHPVQDGDKEYPRRICSSTTCRYIGSPDLFVDRDSAPLN